ncbi:hypothetical protein BCB4_0077 [Bacillus phage B4]|uniref:Uncharacterized protein n=2 Tax=Bequatrovirus B4 TaxID=1918005 RepID=J9PRS4_9CAUD|nr:hypothetical protein BCB4_0077 [Bacillus phage B4]YP_009783672.1 hypothetical protein QLX26_gp076 [Bacillus phage B5S]AEW47310.1 hypothetical protein B5S_0076 [Bacillus phage B5S]AEZ65870.1 hypothetical protein BCB4_0077 [Bacillus phage B4]
MERLTFEEWKNVFRNVEDINRELREEGLDEEPLEVTWLEGDITLPYDNSEYVISSGCEVIEDGFNTREEAQKRLDEVEKEYYEYMESLPKA